MSRLASFLRLTEQDARATQLCGFPYGTRLREDGSVTHVRHTLSCFLRHHTYVRLADRDGVHEYVCVRCGHPLVFPADTDPFDRRPTFTKKVRYACGLFGHRVREVAERDGFVEYACHCGHGFLKPRAGARTIRHPLVVFQRASRAVSHASGRLRGVRVRGLRASVLLRRSSGPMIE